MVKQFRISKSVDSAITDSFMRLPKILPETDTHLEPSLISERFWTKNWYNK